MNTHNVCNEDNTWIYGYTENKEGVRTPWIQLKSTERYKYVWVSKDWRNQQGRAIFTTVPGFWKKVTDYGES